MKLATLVLQDGTVIEGQAFGAETDAVFELVFNTSMTGYQEILTDPSYRGQGVLFTVSHIGNVGINLEDDESAKPQVSATVIRSLSPVVSNWRSALSLSDWLTQHNVPGISGIDTRWLTRKLRDGGTQKAALSTQGTSPEKLLAMAREWSGLDGRDMVKEVTCEESYRWVDDEGSKWVNSKLVTGNYNLPITAHFLCPITLPHTPQENGAAAVASFRLRFSSSASSRFLSEAPPPFST